MVGFDLKEAMQESENYYGEPLFNGEGMKWDADIVFERLKFVRSTMKIMKKQLNDKKMRTSMPSETAELYENVYSLLGVIEDKELNSIKYGE